MVPKWRGECRQTRRPLLTEGMDYSFDKYFQLCRSHLKQQPVLIVQWMLGPHQGLGDVGQGYISMWAPSRAQLSEAAALRTPRNLARGALFSLHL